MKLRRVFFTRLFALLGICAVTLDILFILTIGMLRSTYNGISTAASLLGVPGTPYARVISGWWILYGIMLVCFAIGLLWSMTKDNVLRWTGPTLIAIFGIFDGIGSAVFPCDPGCTGLTASARMHVLVSAIGIVALIPSPFFCWLSWRRDPRWRGVRRFSMVIQIAAVVLLLILLSARVEGVADFLNPLGGLLQRLLYTLYYLWLVSVGVNMYRLSGTYLS
jgi:hypothetical protein